MNHIYPRHCTQGNSQGTLISVYLFILFIHGKIHQVQQFPKILKAKKYLFYYYINLQQ